MSAGEDLKILLVKEKTTITELAKMANLVSDKKYTVYGLSQKMIRNTMQYDELKFLAKLLGYRINFEKITEI